MSDLLMLSLQELVPTKVIDRPILCRGHQPRSGIPGNAIDRPLFERRHERVLRQVLGQTDIADEACEGGDNRGASMRHTASIAARVSEAITASDLIIPAEGVQPHCLTPGLRDRERDPAY